MAKMDDDIMRVAQKTWPGPLHFEEATGGLFNRVLRVGSPQGARYMKRFSDAATSGNYPPLPTTASQRCLVAASWHRLAVQASDRCPGVAVPELESVHNDLDLIVMHEVEGKPLHELLVAHGGDTGSVLGVVISWLAALHELHLEPRTTLSAASGPFKSFKIDLQYTRLLGELPQRLLGDAQHFVDEYLAADAEPVHGDINSRNVLVDDASVSVIDFEQGHFGEGAYDLAYILSEYVIRGLRDENDVQTLADSAWEQYCGDRRHDSTDASHRRFRIHLAFQTLYRLVGPSRKVWTGHLDGISQKKVRSWSVSELEAWLQAS